MEILEKKFAGLCCCCLELDRKCREIKSYEFHHTLNANILGLGDPSLMKFFPEIINLYSLIMNVLLGHCDNFIFSYFFFNFAFLYHSTKRENLSMQPLWRGKSHIFLDKSQTFSFGEALPSMAPAGTYLGSCFLLLLRGFQRRLLLSDTDSSPYVVFLAFGSLQRLLFPRSYFTHIFSYELPLQSMESCYLIRPTFSQNSKFH